MDYTDERTEQNAQPTKKPSPIHQTLAFCEAYGGAAVSGSSLFIPCTDGLRELQIVAGTHLVPGWRASGHITGSPVIGGQTVYAMDSGGGLLYALNATTGKVRAAVSVGTTSRFATPTLSRTNIFIGTLTGIVAVGMT